MLRLLRAFRVFRLFKKIPVLDNNLLVHAQASSRPFYSRPTDELFVHISPEFCM